MGCMAIRCAISAYLSLFQRKINGTIHPRSHCNCNLDSPIERLPFGDDKRPRRQNGTVVGTYPFRKQYDATKRHRAVAPFGGSSPNDYWHVNGSITVSGFVIGQVTRMAAFPATNGVLQHEWIQMSGWTRTREDASVPDDLWRTLVADRGPDGTPAPLWYCSACQYWVDFSQLKDIDLAMVRNNTHPPAAMEAYQKSPIGYMGKDHVYNYWTLRQTTSWSGTQRHRKGRPYMYSLWLYCPGNLATR